MCWVTPRKWLTWDCVPFRGEKAAMYCDGNETTIVQGLTSLLFLFPSLGIHLRFSKSLKKHLFKNNFGNEQGEQYQHFI